jgi:hypothetical protein
MFISDYRDWAETRADEEERNKEKLVRELNVSV